MDEKKRVWFVENDQILSSVIECSYSRHNHISEPFFKIGKSLKNEICEPLIFTLERMEVMKSILFDTISWLPNTGRLLLCRKSLAKVIQTSLNDKIEILDAQIIFEDDSICDEFCVINPLFARTQIDEDLSIQRKIQYRRIWDNFDIYVHKNSSNEVISSIFVEEYVYLANKQFRDICEKHGSIGIDFREMLPGHRFVINHKEYILEKYKQTIGNESDYRMAERMDRAVVFGKLNKWTEERYKEELKNIIEEERSRDLNNRVDI